MTNMNEAEGPHHAPERSYFPIRIRICSGERDEQEMVCQTPDDIPRGITIRILATRVTE